MDKWIFITIILVAVALNSSAFILPLFIPELTLQGAMGVDVYQKDLPNSLTTWANSTTSNPEAPMTQQANLIYRVLDMINIGFISSFVRTVASVPQYLYAFPTLVMRIIGPMLDDGAIANCVIGSFGCSPGPQYNAINGMLITFFSIGYGFAIFGLWSGREMFRD